ncbi:MAG: nucleotidyltransferase family protein [Gemmatimonadota bacterium]|nr:nucleotidyltransferase family protein [Gemmatimonadota bacterium]
MPQKDDSSERETVAADAGWEGHDVKDKLAAQRVWIAHLRGEVGPNLPALTDRQWACLAEEAMRHRLRGLTYRRVADGPLADQVPSHVRDKLRSSYVDGASRNALFFRQTAQMARELAARGIPLMLLKGMHLSRFVYAEPGLRSMADVDVMVRREHLAEAEQVYIERGFGPLPRPDLEQFCTWSNHLAKMHKVGAPVVELHWSIEKPANPFSIDHDGLWARSRAASLEGALVHILSPEDLLLHLALHGTYHHRLDHAALKGLMDVDAVIAKHANDIDWQVLTERARAWGASGFVYSTFRLATEILGTPFPPSTLRSLPHQRADDDVVDVARRFILMPRLELPKVYVELAQSHNFRQRSMLVLRNIFLPRERMERVYELRTGTPLVYAYYGIRLADLVKKRSVELFRALFVTRGMQHTLDREEERLRIVKWVKDPTGQTRNQQSEGTSEEQRPSA